MERGRMAAWFQLPGLLISIILRSPDGSHNCTVLHRDFAWFRAWFSLVPTFPQAIIPQSFIVFVLGSGFGSAWFQPFHMPSSRCPSLYLCLVPGLVPLGSRLSTGHRQAILHRDCAWSLPTALAIDSRGGHMKNEAVSEKQKRPIS